MRRPRDRRRVVLGLLSGVLLATGCAPAGGPPRDRVLRLALEAEPHTLDPAVADDVAAIALEHLVYAGLVGFDAQARVVPDLAEGWEVREGGRTYRFQLRPGLRFSDGRPLTSRDVAYSMDRQFWPATKGTGTAWYAAIAGVDPVLKGQARHVAGIRPLDARTLDVTLSAPSPAFLSQMALAYTSVIPEGDGEKPGFDRHPVGAGPFELTSWKPGQRMGLAANPRYFRAGEPRLAGIRLDLGLGEQVASLRFERGELDLLGWDRQLGAATFLELWQDPTWRRRFLTAPDNSVNYVGMNCQLAPFTDVRVREAVAMAIDRPRLLRLVNGRGVVAQGILPPHVPGFDATLRGYPYDPAGARRLLAEAGFPRGFATAYWSTSNGLTVRVAQAIQQDLAAVGIRAQLKPQAAATYYDAVGRKGVVPMFSGNWSQDYPDASDFLPPMFAGDQIHDVNSQNTTFFSDPQVDAGLHAADRELDPVRRLDLYRRAERRIVQLAPVVPLYHPVRYALAQPWVRGFHLHPVWALDPLGLDLAPAPGASR